MGDRRVASSVVNSVLMWVEKLVCSTVVRWDFWMDSSLVEKLVANLEQRMAARLDWLVKNWTVKMAAK